MPRITLLILLVLFGMTLHAQESDADARKAVGTYNAGLLQGAFRNRGELHLKAITVLDPPYRFNF